MIRVVELAAADTFPMRRSVLRDGTVSDAVEFDGDDAPGTFHLGADLDGQLIGISSWMERRYPDLPGETAHQLRGMATLPGHRGAGTGGALLAAGVAICHERGSTLVWARARESALGFYERHGFEVVGRPYVDLTTGLPHRDIVHRIGRRRGLVPVPLPLRRSLHS